MIHMLGRWPVAMSIAMKSALATPTAMLIQETITSHSGGMGGGPFDDRQQSHPDDQHIDEIADLVTRRGKR